MSAPVTRLLSTLRLGLGLILVVAAAIHCSVDIKPVEQVPPTNRRLVPNCITLDSGMVGQPRQCESYLGSTYNQAPPRCTGDKVKTTEACATDNAVGSCRLRPAQAEELLVTYYCAAYDAASALAACQARGGVYEPAPGELSCTARCAAPTDCTTDYQCDPITERCVECFGDEDCVGFEHCVASVCELRACDSNTDCPDQVCDEASSTCVDCVLPSDCLPTELCRDGLCVLNDGCDLACAADYCHQGACYRRCTTEADCLHLTGLEDCVSMDGCSDEDPCPSICIHDDCLPLNYSCDAASDNCCEGSSCQATLAGDRCVCDITCTGVLDCGAPDSCGGFCTGCPAEYFCDLTLATPACASYCGNGRIDSDPLEICDGAVLPPNSTCPNLGYEHGTVDCASDCSAVVADSCGNCGNGIHDGLEAGTDCGRSVELAFAACSLCPPSSSCELNQDCRDNACVAGVCTTCDDGHRNGDETGIDCGGSCLACPGQACTVGTQCSSHVCQGTAPDQTCAAPACDDGFKNGLETGVDCGGASSGSGCAPCTMCCCLVDEDCVTGSVCDSGSGWCII